MIPSQRSLKRHQCRLSLRALGFDTHHRTLNLLRAKRQQLCRRRNARYATPDLRQNLDAMKLASAHAQLHRRRLSRAP